MLVFFVWLRAFYIVLFPCISGRRSAYNWLTGSSVDTLAEYSLSSESLSALLVFDKKKPAAWRPTGDGFGTRRLASPSDEGDSRSKG